MYGKNKDVSEVIEKVAKFLQINDFSVKFHEENKKGEGFLGEIFFFDLTETNGKVKKLLVKRAFKSLNVRKASPIRKTFLNEIYFYKTILPEFQKFQLENSLLEFKKVAECPLTSNEDGNEYLVLENLKQSKFEVINKTNIVTYDHYKLIFKTYGEFHAISHLYKKQNPEDFQKLTNPVFDVLKDFFTQDHFMSMINEICNLVYEKLVPGEDDEVIESFKKHTKNAMDLFNSGLYYKGDYPILCHGDCWSNNLMFKYDSSGKLEDIRILDWQLIRLGSPVQDLSYCLYSGGDKSIFDKLEDLLEIYYQSFSATLKKAGEIAEEIYPYSELKKEWGRYSRYGLVMGFLLIKIKLTVEDDIVDLVDLGDSEDKEEMAKKMANSRVLDEFDGRVRDLLRHAHEINIL